MLRNIILLSLITTFLTACALQTAIKKRDLNVQTKMSNTIFLEPVGPAKRTVFVNIRNTSDASFDLETPIKNSLSNRGYTIVNDPDQANFMLQANVLKIGETDAREASTSLDSAFGAALLGTELFSSGSQSSDRDTALISGALGFLGDALVEDVYFEMVTDIQVRERPQQGEVVAQTQVANVNQGSSSQVSQTSSTQARWKLYNTRIVSVANKVNLSFDEAQPKLVEGLVNSISGLF